MNGLSKGSAGDSKNWLNSLMVPLLKSEGKIRPIAIDNVFIRLVGRLILSRFGKEVGRQLWPHQYAIGITKGIESLFHRVSQWSRELRTQDSIIQLDLTNAFGTISRQQIQNQLELIAPDLVPYFKWAVLRRWGSNSPPQAQL